MPSQKGITAQLKQANHLTHAAWSVLAEREGGEWIVRAAHGLTKQKQTALGDYLSQTAVDAWLCGSLSGGHTRSGSLPKKINIGVERIFVFPVSGQSQIVLVGARQQSAIAQRIWGFLTSFLSSNADTPKTILPDFQAGLAFELPIALDKVLTAFVNTVSCQGAWLAIRRGEALDVQAEWNDPQRKGISIPIESSSLLRKLNRTLAGVSVERSQLEWKNIPQTGLKSTVRVWICLPFVVGQRLIGTVALWRNKPFTHEEMRALRDLTPQAASSVDTIVTFAEMATHLRRLGMLNDFVLTVSSAQNLDQIARRVFGLLTRAFNSDMIAMYLPSIDEIILREFRNDDGKFSARSVSVKHHPLASYFQITRIQSINDSSANKDFPFQTNAQSALLVPLRYRGRTIGLLTLESPRPGAFSQPDEYLLVVIASHLAGLIEYGRLREEAEGRARNLGLIHEVVQQVIGLTDKYEVAQITSYLLAQYFAYELAVVILIDKENNLTIQGFGGKRSKEVQQALAGSEFLIESGITGRVFSTGENMLVNDTSQEPRYLPVKKWTAGSEMCVALKDGERILGIIDIESSEKNTFTNNDLLAIESLAGVLAAVVSSADQYQRLQDMVSQLRLTQMELNARMEAQRAAESRLVQAAKLAAVGEMSAGIAHELNNPLTTVTGFAELILRDMPDDAPNRTELEMVMREARRATDVVRRLLDFSRQGERTRARADINEVVGDVVALTNHLIRTNDVQLSVELAHEPPWPSVDRNQMKQVLLNLIHNGLQAMPDGGQLFIVTEPKPRDGRKWMTVSVQDTGVGIAEADRERIFEPFYTTRGDSGGTGLGLSVTYGIVTDHGGQIDVQSQLGEGSRFTVWLPL